MKYKKPIKIYLFKDQDRVDVSIKVNSSLVNGYRFKKHEFESILYNWKTGIEFPYDSGYVYVQYKKQGHRPEKKTSPYVRFSVSINGVTYHHRLSYDDMYEIEKEYFYQSNNKMYWDENV
jgi:hypothetical protein